MVLALIPLGKSRELMDVGCCNGTDWAGSAGDGVARIVEHYDLLRGVLPGNMWAGIGHNPFIATGTLPPGLM